MLSTKTRLKRRVKAERFYNHIRKGKQVGEIRRLPARGMDVSTIAIRLSLPCSFIQSEITGKS